MTSELTAAPYAPDDLSFLRRLAGQRAIQATLSLPRPEAGDAEWAAYVAARAHARARLLILRLGEVSVGLALVIEADGPEIQQIGYAVDEAQRNRGLATRALGAITESLFGATRCQRAQATVEPDNHASRRVLEKCGFAREGRLRKGAKIAGALRDVDLYARLKP